MPRSHKSLRFFPFFSSFLLFFFLVAGKNYLTFGGGGTATYIYEAHGSYIVVMSATASITNADLNKGTDTTSCTQQYSRMLDDDGVQVRY